jgi:endonuclease-3
MPAITNKQQLLNHAHAALKKRFPLPALEAESPRPLLEELIFAICREGSTTADATAAFERLRKTFVDWNEIRVSTVQEVADALRPLPQAGPRAGWIIGVLHAVFELNYAFDLGDMEKKGLKQAAKQVSRYFNVKDLEAKQLKQAAKQISRFKQVNDFAVAWVVQRSLGGHAIPLDGPTVRVLQRLGVIDPGEVDPEDLESLRSGIEHVIPKARGPEFTELFSIHAKEICTEKDPLCAKCPLLSECPAGQELTAKKPEKDKSEQKPKKSR